MMAMMRVPMMAQTHTITIGSMAVWMFFTMSSISLLNWIESLVKRGAILPVCSQILTTDESAIGK